MSDRRCRLLAFFLAAFAGIAVAAPPAAPKLTTSPTQPLAFGETFAVDSKVLGELRVINVYLPPGYAEGNAPYPVLYLLDGGVNEDFPHIAGAVDVSVKNAVMRPFVVVGVKNTERRRDMMPPSDRAEDRKIAPNAGGADKFRRFLRDELKPLVAARYRTTGETALISESFAGLFVVDTLVADPALFDTYIAVSPALWWNDQALVRALPAKLAAWPEKKATLWFASASDDIVEATDAAAAALKATSVPALRWHYEPMPVEKHSTIFPVAALKALRTLFAPSATP